jgi:hypothetical protein
MNNIEIYNEGVLYLDTNPSGTLNQQNLEFSKRTILFDAIRPYANILVKHIQDYPENNKSKVNLECDFVIIDRETYDNMISKLKRKNNNNSPKIKV